MFFRRNRMNKSERSRGLRRYRVLARVETLGSRQLFAADFTLSSDSFASDRVLFQLNHSTPTAATSAVNSFQQKMSDVQKFGSVSSLGLDGWYRLDLHEQGGFSSTFAQLSQMAGVINVIPDFVLEVATTPNDPNFSSLYGLQNIEAPLAWDFGTSAEGVVVAVIDTGVDYTHPDLASNIWVNPGEIAGNGIDDDGNGFVDDTRGWDFANNDNDPYDDNGHGTHVAGTIGAVGNNGLGIAGVAWEVEIMPLKFLDRNGSGYLSDAVEAIQYATLNGAKIVNASFGGGGFSSMMLDAIRSYQESGGIFVAAAGNESNNNDLRPSYPANYDLPAVVSVAASTQSDALASFSNFGSTTVDIAAPGSGILSTLPGNRYGSLSGTSMAAPHVAGSLALLWAQNPALSNFELIDAVMSNADELLLDRTTHGLLNVGRAAEQLNSDDDAPVDLDSPFIENVQWEATQSTIDSIVVDFSETVSLNRNDYAVTGPNGQVSITRVESVGTDSTKVRVVLDGAIQVGDYSLSVLPTVADLAGNRLDQNRNGTGGEASDAFTSAFSLAPPDIRSYTTAGPIALQDAVFRRAGVTIATINVTDAFAIDDINVELAIDHTWVSDLRVRLIAPNGRALTLVNRRGGSSDDMRLTLDDQASTSISATSQLSGSFRPEESLSAFRGLNTSGQWRIEITDYVRFDTGVLQSASLRITAANSQAARAAAPVDNAGVPKIAFSFYDAFRRRQYRF